MTQRSPAPPPASPDPASGERITAWRGFQLSAFQIEAIEALRRGDNVLVSAPTGAGKTLVAEYAVEDAVRRGRRCVYTAPIKALSNQKFRDFRAAGIDVGVLTGDVTLHPRAQVLVMTTEILRNAILEDPRQLADVEHVVFDEVHFLDDPERGSVWEESLIFAPESIRFVCLSATISNLDQLGSWLREIRPQELSVVRCDRRPVRLKNHLFSAQEGLFSPERLGRARKRLQSTQAPAGRGKRGGRRGGPGGRRGNERRGDRPDAAAEAKLFDELERQNLLPALVFSFSRRECERLARRHGRRRLLDDEELERMQVLQRELLELYQLPDGLLEGEVLSLARRGSGYHHAGMLPVHKELVERMFTSGLLKLLFTTETFALGINMPARTVVFQGLRKFDGVNFDYLRRRDFMQMAGRAGRLGIDKEGHVVTFLTDRDLEEAPLDRLLRGKPEPVSSRFRLDYSTLLHLVEHLGREGVHEAWEKSFDQYQHRAKSAKARERHRRDQRSLVRRHFEFLEELGYLEADDTLTPRGRLARRLFGCEIQVTELVFRGALEDLPAAALATVFVGLVHEERRRGEVPWVPPKMFGGVRRHVDDIVSRLARAEAAHDIPTPMRRPQWGLTPAVLAWVEGAEFEDLEEVVGIPAGDVCRTFRMGIQILRQLRHAIGPEWSLHHTLGEAMEALNRDEVDARRQLELG